MKRISHSRARARVQRPYVLFVPYRPLSSLSAPSRLGTFRDEVNSWTFSCAHAREHASVCFFLWNFYE